TSIPTIDRMTEPVTIAAHRSSILFQVSVPFDDPCCWSKIVYFPHDYFDKWLQLHRCQQQCIMMEEDMSILCHGDKGGFTVADLTYHFNLEVQLYLLHHSPSASDIPPDMKINLYSFRTDVVVTIGERCLCWVDYYHGMLLIYVLTNSNNNNNRLRYIPLSSKALKTGLSDGDIIKLVYIITKEHPSPYPFTIETWTLVGIHQSRREKDVNLTMGASDEAKFPMVSLVDPDIICFLLKDKGRDTFWMVQVNMQNKLLLSRGCRNYFFGHDFITSKFSFYLSEDAIK
ncbi:hypothetical protein ACJX0J_022954, partial [Zea mays]